MAMDSPLGIGTLAGLRNKLALLAGFDNFGDVQDQQHEDRIDNAIEEGLDRIAVDGDLKTLEREGLPFNTVLIRSGADGAISAGAAVFTSVGSTFQTWGVAAQDKISYGPLDGWVRILSVDSETQLTLEANEPGTANLTAQSFDVVRDEFTLAADAFWIKRIWDATNARPIELVGGLRFATFRDWIPETGFVTSDTPTFARIVQPSTQVTPDATTVGTRVRLYPSPSVGLTIKYTYYKAPSWKGGDHQAGSHMGNLLYFVSAAAFLLDDDDAERATQYETKYAALLPSFKARDSSRAKHHRRLAASWGPNRDVGDVQIIQVD